jgi:hypothetical protein
MWDKDIPRNFGNNFFFFKCDCHQKYVKKYQNIEEITVEIVIHSFGRNRLFGQNQLMHIGNKHTKLQLDLLST